MEASQRSCENNVPRRLISQANGGSERRESVHGCQHCPYKTQIPNPNLTLFPLELKARSIDHRAVALSGKSSALEEDKGINPPPPWPGIVEPGALKALASLGPMLILSATVYPTVNVNWPTNRGFLRTCRSLSMSMDSTIFGILDPAKKGHGFRRAKCILASHHQALNQGNALEKA